MTFLTRIFGGRRERERLRPLYDAVVAAGRAPVWYRDGEVPDSVEGRFEMIAATLSLVLLRLEADGEATRRDSVFVVGKHIGKIMGAVGGRLGVFRGAGSLDEPVRHNIFRNAPPSEAAVAKVAKRLEAFRAALAALPSETLLNGNVPTP
ncbi:MAG: ubiquinol-cytochrome C chaperone [Alphaproteobacteria bacterium]|nr:MAG: ubiquinol-cytochrome C chaperone [Alphaproteobacteria bacterium]